MYISDGFDKFRKNVIDKTGHDISGQTVYLIQTEDIEGNITDEKYGINLRTDLGMIDNDGTRVVMFLGTGTTPSSYTDAYMENINSAFSAQMSGGDNVWTTEYDSTTGMITTFANTEYATYDYNITGVASDIVFTEIGTSEMGGTEYGGYYYNKLTTRSLIYDQEGHVSSITKRLNEKLIIKIYKSFSMHEDIIIDAYDQGEYLLIDLAKANEVYRDTGTSHIAAKPIYFSSSRTESGSYQISYVSCSINRHADDDDAGINTSNYSNTVISGSSSIVIEDKNFYYDKIYMKSTGCVLAKKVKLDIPETLVCEGVYTNNQSSGSLVSTFGKNNRNYTTMRGVLPVTDLKITDSKSFNYASGNWDIQDSFNNTRYDMFKWMNSTGSLCMVFNTIDPSSQADSTFYVCVNDDDSKQLTSIWTSAGSTFYLAEKYWDTSTWVQVSLDPDSRYINTIPAEAKYYRYFISKETNPYIEFYRDGLIPAITDVFTPYDIANVPAHTRYSPIFVPITSETYKWILIESHVLAMNNDGTIAYSHRVYGDSNDSAIDLAYIRAGFDNKLVVSSFTTTESTPRNIRIYDMTTMTSDNAPTYVDVAITSSAFASKCYFTKSTSYGYVAIWVPNDNSKSANIIDINTGTNVIVQDAIMFHIQDFTSYAIYGVTGTSPFQFNVYDLISNEVVDTFTIPEEHTEAMFTSVCGCGDNFYIQFGSGTSQVVYMYTLSTNQLAILGGVALNLDSSYSGSSISYPYHYPVENRVRCYHPDGMIISGTNSETLFITSSDPANPIRLFRTDKASNESISLYTGLVSHIAEYNPDGNTSHLLLLDSYNGQSGYNHNEHRHVIADIGIAFKTHSSIFNPYARWTEEYVNWSGSQNEVGGVVLYNGKIYVFNGPTNSKVYPLKTVIPHKLTVQTYTYQQYNNPKSYKFSGRYNIARSNHGNIIAMPSPPATFNISGAADGSGTGMRFKSYWKWRDYGSSQFSLKVGNDTSTGGGEFALGLNKAFKVLPGNVVTASVTLKNTITHISRLDAELFIVEDNDTDPIGTRITYSKHLTGDIGSGITIPTGSYSTQYLRVFLNVRAFDSSNNLVPIVVTYIDTYNVTVT